MSAPQPVSYESARECAICEEEGDATAPLRWRRTLNGRDKLPAHAACHTAEVAHIRAEQNASTCTAACSEMHTFDPPCELASNASPCCDDGPTGHTQQQHHDASPCYVPACPYCTHALTHHDQPDCWDCTNSGTVCDSEDA